MLMQKADVLRAKESGVSKCIVSLNRYELALPARYYRQCQASILALAARSWPREAALVIGALESDGK